MSDIHWSIHDRTLDAYPSGTDLLKAHKEKPYDILFLDIYMPDQSGSEIAKAVRQQTEDTFMLLDGGLF